MEIKELFEQYRDMYAKKYVPGTSKLPRSLGDRQDTIGRLAALYDLAVKERRHDMQWDENTKGNIEQVAEWLLECPQRGLLLYGSLGNGKSTMLRTIHRLMSGNSYLITAKMAYDRFKESERLTFPRDSVLLVDDLGAEPERCLVYGEEHHPLTDLLLQRYDQNATTIIATNLTVDALRQRYGDRLFDRFSEMYVAILYNAPSYRTQKQ